MAFEFAANAGVATESWSPIVENTNPGSLELVRLNLFAAADGAGVALRLATQGGDSYGLLGSDSSVLALSNSTILSGMPSIALAFGDRLDIRGMATNYHLDRSIQTNYGVGATAPIRRAIAATWSALVAAPETGSRLLTQQWIGNSGANVAMVQLRLGGIAGNPVITRIEIPPSGALLAIPDVGLPMGATLQAMASAPVSYLAIGSDRR